MKKQLNLLMLNRADMTETEQYLYNRLIDTDWYKQRPQVVKDAINKLPPVVLYQFKDSKKQCVILSFKEPESGRIEDVTVTVQKIGKGGPMFEMGMGSLDTNQVFGVFLDDLEPVNEQI